MARYRIKKKAGSIYGGLILRDASGANPVEYRVDDVIDLTPAQLTQFSAMLDFVSETAPVSVDPLVTPVVPQSDLQAGDVILWDGFKWVAQPPSNAGGGGGVSGAGVWNSGASYAKGVIVSYLTGSYLSLNAVAAGGQSPAVDTANWQQLVTGGGEIAYAEILASWGMPTPFTANAFVDIPGLSVVIPAGSPAYDIEAVLGAVQVSWGAGAVAGTLADVHLALVDEANTLLAQGLWRTSAPAASGSAFNNMLVKRRMPATATQKAIRVQIGTSMVTNVGGIVVWAGTGAITPQGINNIGPAHMRARAT